MDQQSRPVAFKGPHQSTSDDQVTHSRCIVEPTLCVVCFPFIMHQDQDCYGGCFLASKSFKGDMANVRVWRKTLAQNEVGGFISKIASNKNLKEYDRRSSHSLQFHILGSYSLSQY